MSYTISSTDPIEFLNPGRQWKMGHRGQLRQLDVSGIINISGDMLFTNKLTGLHAELNGDLSINQNLSISGNTMFQRPPYLEIQNDISYMNFNGTFGLAKHSLPKQNDHASKNLIYNSRHLTSEIYGIIPSDIAHSIEQKKFMIVGTNGDYTSSSDGIYWDEVRKTGDIYNLRQVIWVKEQDKFVIIGDNGYVGVSIDASNITSTVIPNINILHSIAWSPQLAIYLIVGLNNTVTGENGITDTTLSGVISSTSHDGHTWTNFQVIENIKNLYSVIWIPELKRFVAVGSKFVGDDYYQFYASTQDGITWDMSGIISTVENTQIYSVVWSREQSRLSVVGQNGFYASAKAEHDSLVWDYTGVISDVFHYKKVIWISQLQRFIAVGTDSDEATGKCISSIDGIVWDFEEDITRACASICWAEDTGRLLISDTGGIIYYTDPKYVFQTTYNLFEDTTLNLLTVNGGLNANCDVYLNEKLSVSGTTTLLDNLLTGSSNVKVPVSYSTFSVAKGLDLPSNLTLYYDQWHGLHSDGYTVSITPLTQNSFIKLEFKINYACSNEGGETISFRVKNHNGKIIFSDLSLGSVLGTTNRGVYNGLYIDSTGYNQTVSYHLEYLISNTENNDITKSAGILGHDHGNSNIIIAQELYIPM